MGQNNHEFGGPIPHRGRYAGTACVHELGLTMSLIDCPVCGRQISADAEVCPQCGHPNRPPDSAAVGPKCYTCAALATTRCQCCGALSCALHLQSIVGMSGYELRCQSCYSSVVSQKRVLWVIFGIIMLLLPIFILAPTECAKRDSSSHLLEGARLGKLHQAFTDGKQKAVLSGWVIGETGVYFVGETHSPSSSHVGTVSFPASYKSGAGEAQYLVRIEFAYEGGSRVRKKAEYKPADAPREEWRDMTAAADLTIRELADCFGP